MYNFVDVIKFLKYFGFKDLENYNFLLKKLTYEHCEKV